MKTNIESDEIVISTEIPSSKQTDIIEDSKCESDRSPCSLCGRKFLSNRISKHLEICKKLQEKRRKQFDSNIQRSKKSEIALNSEQNKPSSNSKDVQKSIKKSNWRIQHAEFLRSIRVARGEPYETKEIKISENNNRIPSGMIECPSCQRRFSERAADRHIEWCKEKTLNDNKRIKSASNQEAMLRMKARTKYKPPTQTSRPNSKSVSPTNRQTTIIRNNNSRRTSTETVTDSSRTNSTNSRLSVATTTLPAATGTTRATNRFETKNLSKSTGNLSRVASNTRNNINSRASNPSLERRMPNNQTLIVRKNQRTNVQAKVNTGLYNSNGALPKSEKASAPIMKFKEKFPNHQHQRNNTIDYDILRKNSTYDDSPKTVPGVRTGGISPTKSESRISKSEYAFNQIDNIKKRIDMYISGIYDNDLLQRFGNHKQQFIEEYNGCGTVNIERSASAHSIISARGSTSDSSDSGLGSHLPQHDKDLKRIEIFSPSMSEMESNLKIDIRNGSLNDIHHLLEQKTDRNNPSQPDMTPRFCHTCGTKYPNALAKFCYECGSKRFPTEFSN